MKQIKHSLNMQQGLSIPFYWPFDTFASKFGTKLGVSFVNIIVL